ncbi:MAG: acyl-CoA thioesterase [Lentisphaeria bacterium]|nr:acyl-CoA thioesterase [Lentisphaeria bacterium]
MRRRKSYFTVEPGAPAPIEQTIRRRIAFSEVDAMAVAWHGNYPRFFEAAHTELMQKVGLGYAEYAKHQVAAPIVQCHVDYHSALVLDEEFEVRAVLYWNDGARLDIAYTITGSDGRICATGYTVQMFCSLTTREPFIFPPEPVSTMRARWRKGEFHA